MFTSHDNDDDAETGRKREKNIIGDIRQRKGHGRNH